MVLCYLQCSRLNLHVCIRIRSLRITIAFLQHFVQLLPQILEFLRVAREPRIGIRILK